MNFPATVLNERFNTSEEPIEGIISVYGAFGVGKTTFSLQTAINAAKSGKNVVYIYSKPNFPTEKVRNILKVKNIDENLDPSIDGLIFIQTTDFHDLNTIIFNLEFLVLSNLKEKDELLNLIVVDSITDLYKLELDRENKSKNLELNFKLNQIMANLFYINETYGIEILIVNELSRTDKEGVQSGGKVMEYWLRYVIKISRTERLNERRVVLSKPPNNRILDFTLELTEIGFI